MGELIGLGVQVSPTSVRNVLMGAGVGPAGQRGGISWREFIRSQAQSMIACDFFTVDTVMLRRIYALSFIELSSRRVRLAGMSESLDGAWTTQQARNLAISLPERDWPLEVLVREDDGKFTRAFDAVFISEGLRVIHTPVRATEGQRDCRAIPRHHHARRRNGNPRGTHRIRNRNLAFSECAPSASRICLIAPWALLAFGKSRRSR